MRALFFLLYSWLPTGNRPVIQTFVFQPFAKIYALFTSTRFPAGLSATISPSNAHGMLPFQRQNHNENPRKSSESVSSAFCSLPRTGNRHPSPVTGLPSSSRGGVEAELNFTRDPFPLPRPVRAMIHPPSARLFRPVRPVRLVRLVRLSSHSFSNLPQKSTLYSPSTRSRRQMTTGSCPSHVQTIKKIRVNPPNPRCPRSIPAVTGRPSPVIPAGRG
jgi:hypothetical protein